MQLSADAVAFVQSGVSILVAAADGEGRPAVARGIGCRPLERSGRLLVVLRGDEGAEVLGALEAGGPIAVMFSRPQTNRSLQIKGDAVQVSPLGPRDRDLPARYFAAMDAELSPLGHGGRFLEAVLATGGAPLLAVTFQPRLLFDQTPGPRAGCSLPVAP